MEQQKIRTLNMQYKLKEECMYWKQRLLELKLKTCKKTYSSKSVSSKLNNELVGLTERNKEIEKDIEMYKGKIMEFKMKERESEVNVEKVNEEVKHAQQETEDINKEIKDTNDYLWTIAKTENIIQHMLNFPQAFKDKIFKICNDKVNMILQYSPMVYQRPPNGQGAHGSDNANKNGGNNKMTNPVENGYMAQNREGFSNQHLQFNAMNNTQTIPPTMHPMMQMRPPPPNMFYGYVPRVPRPVMMCFYPQPQFINNNMTPKTADKGT